MNAPRIDQPSVLISGAAAGIGRATARLFASRGWKVGICDLDEPGLSRLGAKLLHALNGAGPDRLARFVARRIAT